MTGDIAVESAGSGPVEMILPMRAWCGKAGVDKTLLRLILLRRF